ncbi:MAG: hypothetical protein CYPHOPRED_003840 [Cyphobasidiales sp. Tagirdzhanova-0007]|nr:MAG: hypothetical protein CYPHOPRED_003840 [Cyphobasidiales sp. Tagirdzhanova-0007]
MKSPYRAVSLHELWGSRWHALFTRIFTFDAYLPAYRSVQALGLGKSAARAVAVLAAFSISGIIHEAYNHATPWLPQDPSYQLMTFFLLHGLGLVLEALFTQLTHKRVSSIYGFIWTWTFMIITGKRFGDCWMERGLTDAMPPVEEWEWWRWVVPWGISFPRLS